MGTVITSQYDTSNAAALKDRLGAAINASSLMEVIGGTKIGLKDLISDDELSYNNFATKDLIRNSGGSATGTLVGSASIASNEMIISAATGYWSFVPTGMLGADPNIGCIRFKYTPLYSGTPSTDQSLLNEAGGSGENKILITHKKTSGNLQIEFTDSSLVSQGTLIAVSGWAPVSGQTYEIEFNFNSTTGTQKLYIDGVFVGADHATTFVRTATATLTFMGNFGIVQNFKIGDFQRFQSMQHTSDFASEVPRSVSLTKYSTAEESISPVSCASPFCFVMSALYSFAATVDEVNGSVGFIARKSEVDYYHDGSDWVVSDGSLAQSNTVAEISANVGSAIEAPGQSIEFKVIMKSTDGTGTPSITSQVVDFDYFFEVVDPSKCQVYGYVFDNCDPVEGAVVKIKSAKLFDDPNGNFISINEIITTSEEGYFSVFLSKSENYNAILECSINFTDSKGEQISKEFKINVPNASSAALDSIIL